MAKTNSPESEVVLSSMLVPLKRGLSTLEHDLTIGDMSDEERERFQRVLKGASEVGEVRRRFWNMLVTQVPKSGYKPPVGRKTEVLDIGCGAATEALVLKWYFGGSVYGARNRNVNITGIDLDQKAIEIAKRRNEDLDISKNPPEAFLPDDMCFIDGDATKLDAYPEIPTTVDVIVIRHQQMFGHLENVQQGEETWRQIFQQALSRLSPDGIIILTSYTDFEHQKLVPVMESLDCEIVVVERNEFTTELGESKLPIDKNVMIVKKRR